MWASSAWGRQIARGGTHAIEDGKPGSDGLDAGVKGREIHVAMRAVVEAIDEAGLGGQLHLFQQGLADQRAHGVRLVLLAFANGWKRPKRGRIERLKLR